MIKQKFKANKVDKILFLNKLYHKKIKKSKITFKKNIANKKV